MPDKPVLHGWDHRAGGIDPILTGAWHYISTGSGISAWSSSTNYTSGNQVTHDVYVYVCMLPNTNVEPNVNSKWYNYWQINVPLFQNGWANITAGTIPNPVPMGYRLAVGPPNILDKDNGSITTYSDHQVEIAGDVAGGSSGTAVFTLPPAYRLSYDVPFPAHDSSMNYVACRLYSAGNFVRGIA